MWHPDRFRIYISSQSDKHKPMSVLVTIQWHSLFSNHIAYDDEKPEEAALFLTMAQLKDRGGMLAQAGGHFLICSIYSPLHQWFISELFLNWPFVKQPTDTFKLKSFRICHWLLVLLCLVFFFLLQMHPLHWLITSLMNPWMLHQKVKNP